MGIIQLKAKYKAFSRRLFLQCGDANAYWALISSTSKMSVLLAGIGPRGALP